MLFRSFDNGASWCYDGWHGDNTSGKGILGYALVNTRAVWPGWEVETFRAWATCYGKKPPIGTADVQAFNLNGEWNAPPDSKINAIKSGTTVTAVNGNKITISEKALNPADNVGIKLNEAQIAGSQASGSQASGSQALGSQC